MLREHLSCGFLGQRVSADLGKAAGSKPSLGAALPVSMLPAHSFGASLSSALEEKFPVAASLWLQQHEVIEAIRTTWDGSSPRNGHQPMKGTTSFISHSCHLPKQPGCRLHRFYSQQFSLQCQLPFLYKRKTLIGFSLLSKKGGCGAIQSQNLFPISSGPEHRSLQTWEGEGGKEGRRQGGREGETRGQSVDTYTSLF